jgi:allantoin racemase
MRLFYQSFGVSRGSREGRYGQVLKGILDRAAAPGTEISIHGLSPHRAIAEQYRYLEFLDKAEVMDNGLRAEKEGYDAVVLGWPAMGARLALFRRRPLLARHLRLGQA